MRAHDCSHPAHDDIHFTAEDDEGLYVQIKEHVDEYHPEMSEDDIRGMIAEEAYTV